MRIMDRYIGRQVLVSTLFAVAVLSTILVLGSVFKFARPLLVEDRAPLLQLLKVVLSVMPATLMFTLPWGFLAAVLLTLGRLSSSNELVGMRMSGTSLLRITLPVFVLGAAFSGLSFWLNSEVAPRAKAEQKSLIYQTISNDPGGLLEPGAVQSRLKEGRIYVEEKSGDTLKNFHFHRFGESDDDPAAYVFARTADLVVDREQRQLRLSLKDAYFESTDKDGTPILAFAGSAEPLLFDIARWEKKSRRKTSGLASSEIKTELAANPGLSEKKENSYRVELAKRSSFSLACLSFAFIGVPLAIGSSRRDSSKGLGLSLAVAGLYFLSLILAEDAGSASRYLVWLPNLLCIAAGLTLLRRKSHT